LPLTLLPTASPPATHIPLPYFTVRIVPIALLAAFVSTDVLFVIHDSPPSYEYAIRFVPPLLLALLITPPPTAMRKFRAYVCDHVMPSAPLLDRAITDVVSPPPPGRSPCARPAPARHIAPVPAPDPTFVGIPVVNKDIGIFANVTAFVFIVGVYKVFVPEFHPVAAIGSIVLKIRDDPAADVAIHEYPVHAIPVKRPKVVFVSVPVAIFHSIEPFTVVV
jgi:hypothetical protein